MISLSWAIFVQFGGYLLLEMADLTDFGFLPIFLDLVTEIDLLLDLPDSDGSMFSSFEDR